MNNERRNNSILQLKDNYMQVRFVSKANGLGYTLTKVTSVQWDDEGHQMIVVTEYSTIYNISFNDYYIYVTNKEE